MKRRPERPRPTIVARAPYAIARTRSLGRAVGAAVLALAIAACVTINVYFPAAEIKDLSRQIESEVQKKAAEEATQTSPPAVPVSPDANKPRSAAPEAEEQDLQTQAAIPRSRTAGGTSLLDLVLGVTPAYAQGNVPQPEISSPAIRKIIDSRAARLPRINEFKSRSVIGENKEALLEILKLDALSDLKERAEVQRLVKAENADREELFKEIAIAKKVEQSQIPKIRETYASTLRETARPGDMIQAPDGAWKQK